MHDGKIIFFFISFILFRLGTLIVGDANLMAIWTVLIEFFWSKVVCIVLVKRQGFTQIWTVLVFLAQNGYIASVKGKDFSQIWTNLGGDKILLLGNVPLDINQG